MGILRKHVLFALSLTVVTMDASAWQLDTNQRGEGILTLENKQGGYISITPADCADGRRLLLTYSAEEAAKGQAIGPLRQYGCADFLKNGTVYAEWYDAVSGKRIDGQMYPSVLPPIIRAFGRR